ncbi:Protein transport protein sec73 [Erysiphe neolycopersici]|uniref:Protein transport protein sec73 n=1 Tax=Erysiphe neolycopersici TaxID=212602 RepID=A0A420I0T0_9PEZI|nr:Protein transport protein sec73 [Erysiphe neolycopersici]
MTHTADVCHRDSTISELGLRRHSLDPKDLSGVTNYSKNPECNTKVPSTDVTFPPVISRGNGKQSKTPCYNSAPPTRQQSARPRRLRILRLGHASESQLSTKVKKLIIHIARLHAQSKSPPPMPQMVEIMNSNSDCESSSRSTFPQKNRNSKLPRRSQTQLGKLLEQPAHNIKVKKLASNVIEENSSCNVLPEDTSSASFETSQFITHAGPPPYGDITSSTLALPLNRLSDSSRSDLSSGDHGVYASTTTTTHTVQTTTTFFRLSRRRKQAPLFNLSHLPKRPESHDMTQPVSISQKSEKLSSDPKTEDTELQFTQTSLLVDNIDVGRIASPPPSFAHPLKSCQLARQRSRTSNKSSPTRSRLSLCDRSTLNSVKHISRELPIILPERYEDDTPAKYLIRLEEAISRGVVASVLSKGSDAFSQAVLRSYMRGFGFFGDPIDMAIRKLLMEVELPKETQQIDRCLQAFANRYHECNPGIYDSPDQAYFIAFSLLILHTDVFNKNNKRKMQKSDYLKNTRGEGIFDEILECFYDNISYTPFIHVEDDLDINGERIIQHKKKKKRAIFITNGDSTKRPSKEPIDPYAVIIDRSLDSLRLNLKDVLFLEEHYSYIGTAASLNLQDLQKTFFRTGILQIVSARSRPDAFMSDVTVNNPEEAQAGIVDIKITKVGLLWRKDPKKKKTRSPWQEWGAILTGAQLYFFKNTNWIKSLMHQLETHIRHGHDGIPVIFKPPLDQFKPDALMSTDDSVALMDSLYKKHKNAFVFVRHAGFEETFIADNEDEMNDWLAKLNYAAAFRTSGVRMRGVVGGSPDGQRSRGIRRLDDLKESYQSVHISTGELNVVNGKIDAKMAQDILSARREIMLQKIADGEEKLAIAQKNLDNQLRNARHLQILAPIQQKTRENILMAAGRIAAQLKWGRIRIWRLKCHIDILSLDLEEEKNISLNGRSKTAESSESNLNNLSCSPLKNFTSEISRISEQTSASTGCNSTKSALETADEDKLEIDDNSQSLSLHPSSHNSHNQSSWDVFISSNTSSPRISLLTCSLELPSPDLLPIPSKSSLSPEVNDIPSNETPEQAGLE